MLQSQKKKVREKSRECNNYKPQPLPRHQEEEETDKSKQAQIEQTYEKHWLALSSLSEVIVMLKGLKIQEENDTG